MNLPTIAELKDCYCTSRVFRYAPDDRRRWGHSNLDTKENSHFEEFSIRRYNYAPGSDTHAIRLVFLKDVLKNPTNKTLRRNGRFIWCKNLEYEGRSDDGFRQISFTVDDGKKRFQISENNILCIPSKIYVNNNRYFRNNNNTFGNFSSVFSYENCIKILAKNQQLDNQSFKELISKDSPFKPGTLVCPRKGYFYPAMADSKTEGSSKHPPGIVLGPSFVGKNDFIGKEFYRVRFGDQTYERVHPVQMEILNEV